MIWFEDNEAKRAQANEVTFRPRRRNEVELSLITTERKVKWFGTKWNEIKWASLNWNEMGYGRKRNEVKSKNWRLKRVLGRLTNSAWEKLVPTWLKKKVLVWIQYLGNGKSKMRKKRPAAYWMKADVLTSWHIFKKFVVIQSDILSGGNSDTLPDLYLTFCLTYILTFCPTSSLACGQKWFHTLCLTFSAKPSYSLIV